MIRVLVAEDEPPIMRANVAIIESSNSEFKVVSTANNGKKAIEELGNRKIDVVFTDIRMPVMDGLELAKYISVNYPNIITVITSGYSDFEYARKGIEFKVQDYILKPVPKAKLSALLDNIKNEINKRNREKKKKMLFNSMDKIDLDMPDSECCVILACAGALPFYGNDMLVPAVAFWDKISIEKFVSSVLEEGEECMISAGNTMAERIIIVESKRSDSKKRIIEEIFNALKNYDITITLDCKIQIKMSEISKVIPKLRNDMIKRIILTKSQILYCDDLIENGIDPKYSKDQVEYIEKCVKARKHGHLKSCILEVFNTMEKLNATQDDIMSFFDMIINFCYFNAESVRKKISVVKRELYETINNFIDYDSTAEDVVSVLLDITESKQEQLVKKPKLIDDIQEYLKVNYQKSMTNTVLSKEFGFVPSYISRLFKQYNNGTSPGEYLSNYRIEKAKKIMQKQPELLVKEIADMVGFNDAYYFSKIFKKKTGMWPTEYYGNKKEDILL